MAAELTVKRRVLIRTEDGKPSRYCGGSCNGRMFVTLGWDFSRYMCAYFGEDLEMVDDKSMRLIRCKPCLKEAK